MNSVPFFIGNSKHSWRLQGLLGKICQDVLTNTSQKMQLYKSDFEVWEFLSEFSVWEMKLIAAFVPG